MRTSRNLIQWIEVWNRKFHYYLGLYLLWFIWLFALSGLLLNHPKWSAADFWSKRKESTQQQSIELPERQGDLAKAKDLMGQLDLSGEIQWTTTWPSSNRFDFMVIRPGQLVQVQADLTNRVATVKRTTTNGWGIVQMMHTFTGVQISDPRNQRDWLITKLWSFSMDCIVIALLFMVLSSLYMGYCLRKKWTYQAISLSVGVLCCAFFVWGLRLMQATSGPELEPMPLEVEGQSSLQRFPRILQQDLNHHRRASAKLQRSPVDFSCQDNVRSSDTEIQNEDSLTLISAAQKFSSEDLAYFTIDARHARRKAMAYFLT